MDSYENFVPSEWAKSLSMSAPKGSVIDFLISDFLLSWRATSYTATMPVIAVKMAHSGIEGYATFQSPDSSLISFAEAVVIRLSSQIPELVSYPSLRMRLQSELVAIAAQIRDSKEKSRVDLPIEPMWSQYLNNSAFGLALASSQNVAFTAFYSAYETLLIKCSKHAIGMSELRTQQREFKAALQSTFDRDLYAACWTKPEINTCRLVRNAIAHNDGQITIDLAKASPPHQIEVVKDVLQVRPGDLHRVLSELRPAVDLFVTAAKIHPRLSAPRDDE